MKKTVLIFLCLLLSSSLFASLKVLAFAGSTRKDSTNKKLVLEAAQIAKELGGDVTVIQLKDFPIPFYDEDLEAKEGMPSNAKRLRRLMIESDAIIIASPQYNSSISSVLKNVLDWASRSEEGKPSREAFQNKKFAIMSASPGKNGGAKGLAHLRSILEDCGGEVVETQMAIGNAPLAFKNESYKAALRQEIEELFK